MKPTLMVVDRFALAGFDVASVLNITYVVDNPALLMGLDAPSLSTVAPLSFRCNSPVTLMERSFNFLDHFKHRVLMLKAADAISAFREEHQIPNEVNVFHSLHQSQV